MQNDKQLVIIYEKAAHTAFGARSSSMVAKHDPQAAWKPGSADSIGHWEDNDDSLVVETAQARPTRRGSTRSWSSSHQRHGGDGAVPPALGCMGRLENYAHDP